MDTTPDATNGFVRWAENQVLKNGWTNGWHGFTDESASPTVLSTHIERPAHEAAEPPAAEVRAAAAEAALGLVRREAERLESELKAARALAEGERLGREEAERGRFAAEQRLADCRETVWRWLAVLARTPFWRLRRALADPPAELRSDKRLTG